MELYINEYNQVWIAWPVSMKNNDESWEVPWMVCIDIKPKEYSWQKSLICTYVCPLVTPGKANSCNEEQLELHIRSLHIAHIPVIVHKAHLECLVHLSQCQEQSLLVGYPSAKPMLQHGHLAICQSTMVNLYTSQFPIGDMQVQTQSLPVIELVQALDKSTKMSNTWYT